MNKSAKIVQGNSRDSLAHKFKAFMRISYKIVTTCPPLYCMLLCALCVAISIQVVSRIRFWYQRMMIVSLCFYCRTQSDSLGWKSDLKVTHKIKTSSDSGKTEKNIFEAKQKILSFAQFLLVSSDIDIENFKGQKMSDNWWAIISTSLMLCYHVWLGAGVGGNWQFDQFGKNNYFSVQISHSFCQFYQQESWGRDN